MMTPLQLLEAKGAGRYDGEDVTQAAHALQAASCARRDGASEALILAALFHDVGHLLHARAGAASQAGVDLAHEGMGARYLSKWYGPEVCEPVNLHVAAKRLLARDASYLAGLSEESARSLRIQGGPFSDSEAATFLVQPFADDAIRLRHWDDEAKVVDWEVPGLDAWHELASRLVRR